MMSLSNYPLSTIVLVVQCVDMCVSVCIYEHLYMHMCVSSECVSEFVSHIVLLTCPAESRYPCLCKQCRSRSVKPTDLDPHCLSISNFMNLFQQPGSSDLIGNKLQVGVASLFSMTRVN